MKNILIFVGCMLYWSVAFSQDLQAAADDVCECFEEPYEVLEQVLAEVAAAQAQGDYSALLEQQSEMISLMSTTHICFDELPAKYPEINENKGLQNEVMAIVQEQCPSPAENFDFGG